MTYKTMNPQSKPQDSDTQKITEAQLEEVIQHRQNATALNYVEALFADMDTNLTSPGVLVRWLSEVRAEKKNQMTLAGLKSDAILSGRGFEPVDADTENEDIQELFQFFAQYCGTRD